MASQLDRSPVTSPDKAYVLPSIVSSRHCPLTIFLQTGHAGAAHRAHHQQESHKPHVPDPRPIAPRNAGDYGWRGCNGQGPSLPRRQTDRPSAIHMQGSQYKKSVSRRLCLHFSDLFYYCVGNKAYLCCTHKPFRVTGLVCGAASLTYVALQDNSAPKRPHYHLLPCQWQRWYCVHCPP